MKELTGNLTVDYDELNSSGKPAAEAEQIDSRLRVLMLEGGTLPDGLKYPEEYRAKILEQHGEEAAERGKTNLEGIRSQLAELNATVETVDAIQANEISETELSRKNKTELLALASSMSVQADDSMNKADIIAAITKNNS